MKKTKKFALFIMALSVMIVCFMFGASARSVVEKGNCGEYGDNVTYVIYDDGEIVISGTGDMEDEDPPSYSPFLKNKNIKSVVVEEGVTYIGDYTFYNCETITDITLPESIRDIGFFAFNNTGYYRNDSNWEDGALYIGKNLIDVDYDISGEYQIKDGTRTVATYAFNGCKSLTGVKIPDSVTSVGNKAFNETGYYNNKSNWDGKALYIDNCLVAVDKSLAGDFRVKDGTRVISNDVFYDCEKLTNVVLPDSVRYIGREAFNFCEQLTNVTIGKGVESIGSRAFCSCDGLTSMVIPDSVTYIGDGAFIFCDFTNLSMSSNVTYIGNGAFKWCTKITNVVIPGSVTFLGDEAFYGCENLGSLNIPGNIENIGKKAFYECKSLVELIIPETVEKIGEKAFDGCSSLKSATILNKTIELEGSGIGYVGTNRIAGFKIMGFEGSTAQKYARTHKFPFKSLNCAVPSLKEISGNKNSCTVKWNPLDDADQYVVYRSVDGSSWEKLFVTTGNSYTDTNLESGTVYSYTVSACNKYGEGDYNPNGLIYVYLNEPASLDVSAETDGIVFSWQAVDKADGYKVYRKEGGKWKEVSDTKNTSYTDKNVSYGKKYTYTVKAYKIADGEKISSRYNTTGVSATFETVPVTKIISAEATRSDRITVEWEKVSVADQYYLYRSTKSDSGYKCIKKTTSTSYTDKNVTLGTTYYYKVLVVADGKKSELSPYKKVKASLPTPKLYTSFNVTDKDITLRWYEVSDATGYVIYRKSSGGDWKKIKTVKGKSTLSYKDSVTGGYYYKIYAYKTISGKNQYSAATKAFYLKTLKQTKIEVDQYKKEFTDIITWNKVSGASHYQLYYKVGENGSWKNAATVGKNVTEYKFKVTHGKYYYWKVRAIYKKDSITSVGNFSQTDNLIIYYTPDVTVFMHDDTEYSCRAVVVGLYNEGSQTLRVYAKGARMIDANYSRYNRDLIMISTEGVQNNYIEPIEYVDIKPGKSAILTFLVDGAETWYDEETRVSCTIKYDGVKHTARFSSYYGFNYYDY